MCPHTTLCVSSYYCICAEGERRAALQELLSEVERGSAARLSHQLPAKSERGKQANQGKRQDGGKGVVGGGGGGAGRGGDGRSNLVAGGGGNRGEVQDWMEVVASSIFREVEGGGGEEEAGAWRGGEDLEVWEVGSVESFGEEEVADSVLLPSNVC